jgi:hypothetical protein
MEKLCKLYSNTSRFIGTRCALINSLSPGLCPNHMEFKDKEELKNVTLAMSIANSKFGIPYILQPEDLISPQLDDRAFMVYLSYFKNWVMSCK